MLNLLLISNREMLDLTEALTNELGRARNDILHLRRELENRYLFRSKADLALDN